MNCCFYLAISRQPLATVAAIEFLPVVALAALGVRSRRNLAALAIAVPGVYLSRASSWPSSRWESRSRSPTPCCSRLHRAADRVAKRASLSGIDGLAASMLIAAVVVTPLAGWAALPALSDPVAMRPASAWACLLRDPYVTDQLALARLARATYALMVSLLPAFAAVIGVVVLAQIPSRWSSRGSVSWSRAWRCTAVAPEIYLPLTTNSLDDGR